MISQSRAYQVCILVGNSPRRLSLSITKVLRHPSPSTFRLPAADHSPFLNISSISDMSQTSPSSFQDLFNVALRDYENKTGIKLADDPFAKKFENCDSVDSITAILQEQAQIFRKFRGDDGKLMKSLKASVDVLYTLSNTVLGGGIGLVRPNHSSGFLFSYRCLTGFPACERNIRWHRHPTCRMLSSPISSAYFRHLSPPGSQRH